MMDFTSGFWGAFIVVITIVSIIGCLWLLWANLTERTKGPATTMGHVWDDDLAEYNNPMPAWWVGLFVLTIVFALAYLFLYPGLGERQGSLGWSQSSQYQREMDEANARYGALYAQFKNTSIERIASQDDAHRIGESLFLNYCAQCHGSDARGGQGFPNLTDRDWLHGGKPDNIMITILDGRHGVMPPMADALGGDKGAIDMAHYVLSLSGGAHDPIKAVRGQEKFAICAGCHGADARGNQLIGAPNLTDKVWLHGGSLESITQTIAKGRDNQMPAFRDFLGEDRARLLAAYVWSLSNPVTATQTAEAKREGR
ncbi:MAG TPA: cytochrome-c oxidase, cbb3-type subunit III [Burkholderiaceae bacterium]|nr:cytochrome-c oxidase, cbb3-type subunit III [Burkholderiaceae bacterium]